MTVPFESRIAVDRIDALLDERAVIDALYRFGAGQDLDDTALFLSAFTQDAVLDFAHPAARFGVEIPPMEGLAAIAVIPDNLRGLRTTHTVTNPRVVLGRDTASLWALVEAQHVRAEPPHDHLLLKNTYEVEAVRDRAHAATWRIRRMVIRNVWYDGDPGVLFGVIGAEEGARP